MTSTIELSIIIPVYNVEKYLTECLQSAYSITGINKEIIIVDDGSTDQSASIINKFVTLYPNETVVKTQLNQGQSAARNVGITLASGDYILFLDSDDYLDSVAVIDMFHYAQKHELDLVQGRATVFGDVATSVMIMPDEVLNTPICDGPALLKIWCDSSTSEIGDFRPEVWLMLLKKNIFTLNNIQFVAGMLYEDELMVPTLLLNAKKAKAINIPFYHYRIRQGSTIRTFGERHVASQAKLVKEYTSLLKKHRFYHAFLSGRTIGWCKYSASYLSVVDIATLFMLRKFNFKELIRLSLILMRSILRLGQHKNIEAGLNEK